MEDQHPEPFGSPNSFQGPLPPNNSPASGHPPSEQVQPTMLRRALEATGQTTNHQQTNSGPSRTHQTTARSRRGSAAPTLHSGRPRNMGHSRHNQFDRSFLGVQSYDRGQDNRFSIQNIYGQPPHSSQQNDYGQRRGYSQQAVTHHQISYGLHNAHRPDLAVADDHASLQQRLYNVAQIISDQPEMPSYMIAAITSELRDLSQLCIDIRRRTRNDTRGFQLERERLQRDLANQQRLLQNALAERDRACSERDRLQTQCDEALPKLHETEKKLEDTEKKSATTIEFLRRQIRFKDEQINGKRSLWMSNHRNSEARRAAIARDPFLTPSSSRNPGTEKTIGQASLGKGAQMTPGFARPRGLSTDFPKGSAGPSHDYWGNQDINSLAPDSQVEYDSPLEEGSSKALVPFKSEDEISQEFREDFNTTYGLIEAWVRNYAYDVNELPFDQHLSRNQELWPFMLGCTYTNFTDAHEHVILLLRNPETRPLFVVRLIIQYLYLNIWKASSFKTFDIELGQKLSRVEEKLKVKGLESIERAELVATQTRTVQLIVGDEKYLTFRSSSLSSHTKALRTLLGPILNADTVRAKAALDLSVIAANAWDLAAKLFTSNFTFLISFPDCGSKFLHPSMECIDPNITDEALQLHIRQAKIKLAVTPLVTMRNDRNMTISAKKILNARVLLFSAGHRHK